MEIINRRNEDGGTQSTPATPFPIVGSWWVAEPGTPEPANEVTTEHGFVDPWPDGWTLAARRRAARIDVPAGRVDENVEVLAAFVFLSRGHAELVFARPIRHLRYDRRLMLGWQCECRCERLVAPAVVKVMANRARLETQGPDDPAFQLYMASSTASCGRSVP